MGLSDCLHCWETPCVCGYSYLNKSEEYIDNQIRMLKLTKEVMNRHPEMNREEQYKIINRYWRIYEY